MGSPPVSRGGYERVARIAEGGMGVVELVLRREGPFTRPYARKRLHPEYRRDPTFRAMFLDEARLAGSVRHPNVVGVLDVGEDEDGPYLIMELVEGVPVGKLVKHAAARGERIPVQICVRIALDAARGLHAAHEACGADGRPLGLIHRDVSPQNVLVGFDGAVRVSDFGIAKAVGNTSRTATGILKGKLAYLSPDQLRFEDIDRRSDLFSLGVTLYEMLAGQHLYAGADGVEVPRRILHEDPPDILEIRQDVPPALVELLFELLSKDRDQRPATAHEVAERLEGVLAALIAEEGSQSLAAFLAASFGDLVAEERARIEEEKRREASARPRDASTSTAARTVSGAHRRNPAKLARVVGAAVAAAALAVLLWKAGVGRNDSGGTGPGPSRGLWAGGWHTCAISGAEVRCWGKNSEGQLGIGHLTDQSEPQAVRGLKDVVWLGLGNVHTCACTAAGDVHCWGSNDEGQLGAPGRPTTSTPVQVRGVNRCRQVTAGKSHSCARDGDGRVLCWGGNARGQTGRPPSTTVPEPVVVPGLPAVAQIDADGEFTCARAFDGSVFCWGDNGARQLGGPSDEPAVSVPTPVAGIVDATEIALGEAFACASAAGGVLCWGAEGEPISRGMTVRPHPVAIPGLADAVELAADGTHACARRTNGDVLCWGNGHHGQLGDGATNAYREQPVRVRGLPPASRIAAGEVHTCARHRQGVSCWGFNATGQLGDASRSTRPLPVSAVGIER